MNLYARLHLKRQMKSMVVVEGRGQQEGQQEGGGSPLGSYILSCPKCRELLVLLQGSLTTQGLQKPLLPDSKRTNSFQGGDNPTGLQSKFPRASPGSDVNKATVCIVERGLASQPTRLQQVFGPQALSLEVCAEGNGCRLARPG